MFDTIFHYPRVLARHREGPAANDRERFLTYCANGGAAHSTLLSLAPELLVIAQRIKFDDRQSISLAEIEASADHWVAYQRRRHRVKTTRFSRERFIQTATAWLRFLGRLAEPQEEPAAFAEMIREFIRYQSEERGLSPRTIDAGMFKRFYAGLPNKAVALLYFDSNRSMPFLL